MEKTHVYIKAIAIALVFSLTFPWLTFSQTKTLAAGAQIAEIVGKATVTRNGRIIAVTKNMDLMIGDEIRTEASSELCVKYKDGSLLFVREKTQISLQPLLDKPTIGRRIKVIVGKVCAIIKPSKDYETQFETVPAVAAIRGTRLEIEVVRAIDWRIVRIGGIEGKVFVIYEEVGVRKTATLEKGRLAVFRKGEMLSLMRYSPGSICCAEGLLALAPAINILPYLLFTSLGAIGATGVVLLVREEEICICSPAKP